MVCDVAYDLILQRRERVALARYTAECLAFALSGTAGDEPPVFTDQATLLDEFLASELPAEMSEADVATAEWLEVVGLGGGAS